MFIAALRAIKYGILDFFRNFWLSVATVSVLVVTLVSVDILIALNVLGKVAVTEVKSKIDVSVHFKPDVEDSRVQTVKIALLALPEVQDVVLVTPAEALAEFTAAHQSEAEVAGALSEVEENPFGATLIIKARDIAKYPAIMAELDRPEYADLIEAKDDSDRQLMIARVESIASRLQWFGFGVSGVFGFLTLLIVFNTIRVSIYTRRDEIAIMRLVGASDGFIRAPFYVEALLWGFAAVAVSAIVVLPAAAIGQPYLARFFGTSTADLIGFFRINALAVFGGEFLAVVLLAVVTTKTATAKYLKV